MSQVQLQNLGAVLMVHIQAFSLVWHWCCQVWNEDTKFSWTGLRSREGSWARRVQWARPPLASLPARSASPQTLLLPPANPWGWVKKGADSSFSSNSGKNKLFKSILWIHPNYVKCSTAQGLQSIVSLDSHYISRFLLTASICPESRIDGSMHTLEPQQGFVLRRAGVMIITLI